MADADQLPIPSPRRRERPVSGPEPTAAQVAQQVAPPGALAAAVNQRPGVPAHEDPEFLAEVLRAMGLGGDSGPALVDAEDGEGGMVQFVRTGWIRFPAPWPVPDQPSRWRLRRPFLGELRRLRHAWQDAAIEIDEARLTYLEAEGVHKAAIAAADALDDVVEKNRGRLEANKARRSADQAMNDAQVAVRIEWWAQVFRTLCVDSPWAGGHLGAVPDEPGVDGHVPVPEGWEWGTWVEDPNLPVQVIQHWRQVPLDHGGHGPQ